jgi:hypothetical protein
MKQSHFGAGKASVFRGLVLAITALLCGGTVHGQAPGAGAASPDEKIEKLSDLRGEWLRNGPGFACKVAVGARLPPEVIAGEALSLACLHLGPFGIGQDAKALTTALGEPHQKLENTPGQAQLIYFLEQREHYPYLVATVAKERIVALQVTGFSAPREYSFNHIDLGATTDTLISYFGQPDHVEPSELKDTELWAYGVWPFSFEVNGGHVTSIRISEP